MTRIEDRVRAIVGKTPFLKPVASGLRSLLPATRVSGGYRLVQEEELAGVAARLLDAWKDEKIPERQRHLVEQQLQAYQNGQPNPVFDALVDILTSNVADLNGKTLLEVGCSSGYYSEVLALREIRGFYTGCDYSEALVGLARKLYPSTKFDIQDATSLSYKAEEFDIVISGCCILHIPDYLKAIAEAARVSRQYVVFHRTPVLHLSGPAYFTKKAYGVETLEIHFNEQKLVQLFRQQGLCVVDINTHAVSWNSKLADVFAMKTYLCERT